jgi:hypothetical protein
MGPIVKALVLALITVVVLGGCGGGSKQDSAPSQSSASGDEGISPGGEATEGVGKQPPGSDEEPRGGETSIEEFGSEASGAEREAILAAFTDYLEAVAEEDYDTACAYFSSELRKAASQLAEKTLANKNCAASLPKLLSPSASAAAKEQANGKIARVRIEGVQAFVVFHAPGAELYYQALIEDSGEWKMATGVAGILIPFLP